MFPLVPYKHISINTDLSVENAMNLVSSRVAAPRASFSHLPPGKEYEGDVTRMGFKIKKEVRDRWSGRPILYGKFIISESGTTVNVRMTLKPFEMIFWAFWCFPLIVESFISITNFATFDRDPFFLITIAMLGFGYLFVFFTFGPAAKEAEQFLRRIFEGHEIANTPLN